MKTPFLGQAYVARSTNLADQRAINIFPSVVDSKSGKDVAAFYTTPGLTLLFTVGAGPIRGIGILGSIAYVVSGNEIYSVTTNYATLLIGTIATFVGPVSIINNTTQLVVFDGQNGYLVPGGAPLTGGVTLSAGDQYAVGDIIVLQAQDGTQNATAEIAVTSVNAGGAVTGFGIVLTGAFGPNPTNFTQQSTTGSGTGFTLHGPTYGASQGIYLLTLPFVGPVSASYQDGFGVVNASGTDLWYQSNLFDLSIWDDLNFSSADAQPDNIIAIADLHEEQFLFKQNNTEVWINAGVSGFTFQRLAGVHIEIGCSAPFSVSKAGESLVWVTQDLQGDGMVWMVTGYEPKRISTHYIEDRIASYPKISDAIGYSYQEGGHLFYVVTFPSGNETWAVDLSVNPPMWHQRAFFSNGAFSRHLSNCYAFFNRAHIVGDFQNGNLYTLDMDATTDNGAIRKWVRSWRALPQPVFEPMTFSSLQIDMMTGIGVPDNRNPQVVLRWSDDGGHNWSPEHFAAAGLTGQTGIRVMYRRLGSTRLNSGLDRTFELSSTSVFTVALIGADLQ